MCVVSVTPHLVPCIARALCGSPAVPSPAAPLVQHWPLGILGGSHPEHGRGTQGKLTPAVSGLYRALSSPSKGVSWSCAVVEAPYSVWQQTHISGHGEGFQVLLSAGGGLKLHSAWPQQQQKSSLLRSCEWWWVREKSTAGAKGSTQRPSMVLLLAFWLFSGLFLVPFFLLTLPFPKMKYPVYNCSQIVIIICGQMAHSLWSSNCRKEIDSSPWLCLKIWELQCCCFSWHSMGCSMSCSVILWVICARRKKGSPWLYLIWMSPGVGWCCPEPPQGTRGCREGLCLWCHQPARHLTMPCTSWQHCVYCMPLPHPKCSSASREMLTKSCNLQTLWFW